MVGRPRVGVGRMTESEIREAVRQIADAVVESVRVAGDQGAPGGMLYAALMAHGASFSQYQSLMGALVRAGKVTRRGDLYFAV